MKNSALISIHRLRNLATISLLATGLLTIGTGSTTQAATTVPPAITSSTSTSGTTLVPYTYQITASNSPTSYGSTLLPAGLSINDSTGLISGWPMNAGTATATVSASNAYGTGSKTVTFTFTGLLVPKITSTLTTSGTVGMAFSYQIVASNSPTKYTATSLPAGLSLNTTTGAISGTPTAATTASATISATNSKGTGSGTLSMTIAPSAIITAPAQAVAAGFSSLDFDDEFTTSTTIAPSTSPKSGYKWYWNAWYAVSKDYTVNTGAGSGATAGATGILSVNGSMAIQTVPSYALTSQRTGTWQHAYIEARIQYSYTVTGTGGQSTGWPSFWSFAVQGAATTPGEQTAELDFMEAWPLGNAGAKTGVVNTLHNWQSATKGDFQTANTNDTSYQQSLQGSSASAQPTDNGWHTYGCLWTGNGTTGSVQFYYDNHLVVHQYGVTKFLVGSGTSYPALEKDNQYLMLSSCTGWPINVDWVRVWK